jgi:DNA (cytosine-5)-methyltransferase 1
VTVADAFAGLPALGGRGAADGELFELSAAQSDVYSSTTNEYLSTLTRGDHGYLAHPRPANGRVLTGYRATEHKPESIARFLRVGEGKVEPISRAWRLDTTAPSRTLRAGTGRERGAFSASRPLHPTEPRVITVREAARLHSFPDWFRFHTTNWHGHRQIGNAVPPLLARAVGSAVMSALRIDPLAVRREAVPAGDDSLLALSPTDAAKRLDAISDEVPVARRRPSGAEPDPGDLVTSA